jgi:uncharacterized protein (UPF0210 family)
MIRSLTVGLPVGALAPVELAAQAKLFLKSANQCLSAAGLAPRTTRYTLPALGPEGETAGVLLTTFRWVDALAQETGVRWICLPLDWVKEGRRGERMQSAMDALTRFPRAFVNLIIADEGRMAVEAINDAASFVLHLSRRTNNGFDNFRVGASANCPTNAPFFPFSRHEGSRLAFSFALETIGPILEVMRQPELRVHRDLGLIRDRMVEVLVPVLRRIDAIGHELAAQGHAEYCGLDASLAPFPDGQMSVGLLIEQMLGAPVGSQGSVFVTTVLTDVLRTALRESGAKAVGFNGVMFSVLEDDYLAAASSRRHVSIDGLTALAAVCGCGIDMVPVPGTSFQEEIAAVIFDIAALSSTLGKPLGIRLLPIPNRSVNEFTEFNLDFLCDARVLALTSNDHRFRSSSNLLDIRSPLRRLKGKA